MADLQVTTTWDIIMSFEKAGKDEAKGVANTLSMEDLETIVGTIDFFGGDYQQDIFDLKLAKYRVFDWLAMRVRGRHSDSPSEVTVNKVLAHSFIKSRGVPSDFIKDLRETDYDIDTSYESISI